MPTAITKAGPDLARACNNAARNVPPTGASFTITVRRDGSISMTWPEYDEAELYVRAAADSALAINLRGLLLAVREGTVR